MADSKSKGKNLKKIGLIGFVILNLASLSAGAYLVFSVTLGQTIEAEQNAALEKEVDEFLEGLRKEPVMYKMKTFSTNLTGLPRRMVQVDINLEMLDDEGFEEVVTLGAEARDSVIRIFNNKDFTDIETVQGKLLLKNQIIAQVNQFLEKGVVKDVYFSSFLVQ